MNNIYLRTGALVDPQRREVKGFELLRCKKGAEKLGFSWSEVQSKSRKHDLVDVKTCICQFLYDKHWTLKQIGKELNLDHATVVYHRKKFYNLLPIDRDIQIIWRTLSQAEL